MESKCSIYLLHFHFNAPIPHFTCIIYLPYILLYDCTSSRLGSRNLVPPKPLHHKQFLPHMT